MTAPYTVRVSGGVVCLDTTAVQDESPFRFLARVQKSAALAEAAPDLLAVAERITALFEHDHPTGVRGAIAAEARAAIAKARGDR